MILDVLIVLSLIFIIVLLMVLFVQILVGLMDTKLIKEKFVTMATPIILTAVISIVR